MTMRISVLAVTLIALAFAPAAYAAPPVNDDFADRIALGSPPSDSHAGTTVEATVEAGEPDSRESGSTRTVWYTHTPADTGWVTFDACTASYEPAVAVYTGGSLAALEPVDASILGGEGCTWSTVTFYARAGTAYQLQVGGFGTAAGTFSVALSHSSIPPNDPLVSPMPLQVGPAFGWSNAGAAATLDEPYPAQASVWFIYQPFEDQSLVASVCGRETLLTVYRGGPSENVDEVSDLELVGAGTESCPDGTGTRATFTAQAGYFYYLLVDTPQHVQPGEFDMSLAHPVAPNDDFADAIELDDDLGNPVDTRSATREPGEPDHAGQAGAGSVWFTYTAAASRYVRLSASSRDQNDECAMFDSLLGVYTGGAVGALTEVASNDDAPDGCGSALEFFAHAGTTYRIAVDGKDGASGTGGLSASFGPVCTAVGTAGDDVLPGTGGADVLCGLEGNDALEGGGGADQLLGGEGSDRLADGPGADQVEGGAGSDAVVGGTGVDTYFGGPGTDRLDYGARLTAMAVDLGRGTARTGTESDLLFSFERATGGAADDTLAGDDDENRLAGGGGADKLTGLDGDDLLDGGGGNDTVDAGDGDDVVEGSTGADTLDGGPGTDALSYAGRGTANAPVAVTLDGLRNDGADADGDGVSAAAEEGDLDKRFEEAVGGANHDRLKGGAAADRLAGGNGNDLLDGGLGADTLDGGGGFDTITYAARTQQVAVILDGVRNDGADSDGSGTSSAAEEGDMDTGVENATGGVNGDRLTGGAGANVLTGGIGDDVLDGGLGRDTLEGSAGTDTVSYAARGSTAGVVVKLDGVRNDGADPNADGVSSPAEENDLVSGVENATGGDGPDWLVGSAATNLLDGANGDDRIEARNNPASPDELRCGNGTDKFAADAADTVIACETALP